MIIKTFLALLKHKKYTGLQCLGLRKVYCIKIELPDWFIMPKWNGI